MHVHVNDQALLIFDSKKMCQVYIDLVTTLFVRNIHVVVYS